MEISEKIKGAIIGYAIGDALGLGTEFMTVPEVRRNYPEGLHSLSQIIRDGHRCQWERGEWTNDTELFLLLAESVMERDGLDHLEYTRRMKRWYETGPTDLVSVYRKVMSDPQWEEDSIGTAHRIWRTHKIDEASNEGIYRAVFTGILSGDDLVDDTVRLVLLTHDDRRCLSSAVVIARMTQALMWEEKEPPFEELESICDSIDSRTLPFLRNARNGSLEDLKLDDEDTAWYTRKSMSAALWSLWHCSSAEETLHTIVNAGGDADTNAALSMALAGIKYGFSQLPAETAKMLHYDHALDVAERFAAYMEKKH